MVNVRGYVYTSGSLSCKDNANVMIPAFLIGLFFLMIDYLSQSSGRGAGAVTLSSEEEEEPCGPSWASED